MHRLYLSFLRGVSANWVARLGAGLTTATFVVFALVEVLRLSRGIRNPYFDLVLFMALPPLFVGGLVLVGWGWWLFRREQRRRGISEQELLRRQFGDDIARPTVFGSKLAWMIAGLTVLNLVVLGGGTLQMREHMDSAEFCGTTCHVMKPEWTTYQDSPHNEVPCVECHVGEGMDALLASKVRGLQQMYEHAMGIYNRPIPTPVHTLSSAEETCGRCHSPEVNHGNVLKTHVHFALDEANTRTYSTILLDVGTGRRRGEGIHWHASPDTRVVFTSVNGERERVLWVEVVEAGTVVRRFENRALLELNHADSEPREMDCTDCHNRVAHVYEEPQARIDAMLGDGTLDPRLPYLKSKALAAITNDYPSAVVAHRRIRNSLEGYYSIHYPDVAVARSDAIEAAVVALQRLHERNIHYEMRVTWNQYPSFAGHSSPDQGCFRCHSPKLQDDQGRSPSYECTSCHSILAQESPHPFQFTLRPSEGDPLYVQHLYLHREYGLRDRPR